MAIVVVLVLLVIVGVGVGVAMSGKNKKEASGSSTSVVSPTRPTFSQPPPPSADSAPSAETGASTAAARATEVGKGMAPSSGLPRLGYESAPSRDSAAEPAPSSADAADAVAEEPVAVEPAVAERTIDRDPAPVAAASDDAAKDDEDDDLSSRFNPRGERSTGTGSYTPTVPRKPVLLATTDEAAPGSPEAPTDDEQTPSEPAPAIHADASSDDDDVTEDEFEVIGPTSSIEDDVVAHVVAASAGSEEDPEPDADVIIDLDEAPEDQPVLVIDDGPTPLDEVETNDNDNVLKALIGRVRVTQDDVDAVATELGRRGDLDADGVAEVLADLAEIAEAEAKAKKEEELTLFSHDVPSRPGQLTRFAELDESERRRVIIRVLCLLVARAEDSDDEDDATESKPERGGWPGDEPEDAEELDLPNRVSLVQS